MSGNRWSEVRFKVLDFSSMQIFVITCVFGGKDEFVARGASRNFGFGCVVPGTIDLPGLVVIKQVGQQVLSETNCII